MLNAHQSYNPDHFHQLFRIEDRHFWFHARNKVISTLAQQVTSDLMPGYKVLEIGCGTGNVLRVLEQVCLHGNVIGMDLFAEGLQYARQRTTCSLVQGDMHTPPFCSSFNLIGLFDVLEHLPDDVQVLRDLCKMLVPGGILLLTVPAHPLLWSYFDEASDHLRRYKFAELEDKFAAAGYHLEYLTQYMVAAFPLVWLGRRLSPLLNRKSTANPNRAYCLTANELRIIPVANTILKFLLNWEVFWIAHHRKLPIGTSLLAIARKGCR